jgi:hypothetical protein
VAPTYPGLALENTLQKVVAGIDALSSGATIVSLKIQFTATPQVQNYEQAVVINGTGTLPVTYTVTAGYRSIFTAMREYNPNAVSEGVSVLIDGVMDQPATIVAGGTFKLMVPFDLDEGDTVEAQGNTNVVYFFSAREYLK